MADTTNSSGTKGEEEVTAVKCEQVDFFYGKIQALYKVDFQLPRGCRCLLVGDNGAGKTTLLKLLGGKTSTLFGRMSVLDYPADFSPQLNLRRFVRWLVAPW